MRQLAAIMFTDIAGYTALMQQDEQQAVKLRKRHRQVFEEAHQTHRGTIVQYYGDGTLSFFPSAVEAVACAVDMQQAFQQASPALPVRIGLHLGDIVYTETEVYGDGVNVAARIESMGVPGAVLVSDKMQDELKNHPSLQTRSLGEFEFKNVLEPMEVFAIANPGLVVPDPGSLKGKFKQPAKSIAVLPFVNMSAKAENEYLSDGMTEEIINALTRINGLKVTSRTSSFFFKDKQLPLAEIGQQLKVSTVLEGSIRLAGNRMRITAQLIDVSEDYHFWSERFDRPVDDIFAVQDEISLLIAEKLREHLGHLEIDEHLVADPEVPVEAYQRYLKARHLMLKMSQGEVARGMEILKKLVADHPTYAYAHLGVHMGYTLMGTLGYMPAGEAFAAGAPYLQEAIRLDESIPDCQLQLAWGSFLQDWDLEATYRHLQQVKERRPIVDYYQTMTSVVVVEGKFKAGMHYIDTALQMDPFSEINHHLKGFIHYLQEEYEQAIVCFRKSLQLKEGSEVSFLELGLSLIQLGRVEEAFQHFAGLPESAGELFKQGGMALAQVAMGKEEAAQEGIQRLEVGLQSNQLERALHLLIFAKTLMGKFEEACEHIATAISYRLPLLVYMKVDPMLKPLRGLSRFQELMAQLPGGEASIPQPERKYKQSLIEPEALPLLRKQLLGIMEAKKPYLEPELSLRTLAEQLDLPPNQLSQLLNEGFDQNFSEFVNAYRLEAFKQKVADPTKQSLTLLALAYESGFNSKTVFNTYFKKTMGQTPNQYRKSMLRK